MAKTGNIVPLIILVVILGIVAAVAFVAYTVAHEVGHKTRQKLEHKNVSFSKDGMKVGVKHKTQEQQEDAAQRYEQHHNLRRGMKSWLIQDVQRDHKGVEQRRSAKLQVSHLGLGPGQQDTYTRREEKPVSNEVVRCAACVFCVAFAPELALWPAECDADKCSPRFSRHSSSSQSVPLARQTSNQNNLSRTTSAQSTGKS
jgi:hypothetical protein